MLHAFEWMTNINVDTLIDITVYNNTDKIGDMYFDP